jgi:hypothetical protein
MVTTCLQTCNNLCVFTCVGLHVWYVEFRSRRMQFKQLIMKLNEVYHLIIYCLNCIRRDQNSRTYKTGLGHCQSVTAYAIVWQHSKIPLRNHCYNITYTRQRPVHFLLIHQSQCKEVWNLQKLERKLDFLDLSILKNYSYIVFWRTLLPKVGYRTTLLWWPIAVYFRGKVMSWEKMLVF